MEEEERRAEDGAETEAKADEELEDEEKKKEGEEADKDEKDEKTTKTCSHRSESSASSEDSIVSPDKVGLTSQLCHSGHQVIH